MTELHSSLETRGSSAFYVDHPLIEFKHKYEFGQTVFKRGLNATPLIVRKYQIGEGEVMAFTNHEGRNRAHTAFHFHPEFPENLRRPYMEAHRDGCELAEDVDEQRLANLQKQRGKWKLRLKKVVKTTAVVVQSLAIYLLAHHPDSR